ncbi:MAG: patatin-like phospholipase family protein [Burkholderiales bacterium]|nr:patatin-like phospholipase family protein [Burkholderiales bacterium]
MAGGGPLGAIYEVGALAALAESLHGLDFNRLDAYVGVSAGGILGAGLANGITPREMCHLFIDAPADGRAPDGEVQPFDPSMLMRPAFGEYWERLKRVPPLAVEALWRYVRSGRGHGPAGMLGAAEHLVQLLPAGLFSNEPLRAYLARLFAAPGRTDDFRKLGTRLYLIATDLDSGKAVAFGAAGHDAVPISVAATASSALPGLFPPVEIAGRHYVDGALKRTLHASVALQGGADLVICLNPLVPYDDSAVIAAGGRGRRLIDGGLPLVALQTVRAVIHSRMEIGMRQYGDDFPHADVVLFEPNRADAEMFFTNMFSYSNRRRLSEHAYQKTRAELWRRRHELAPVLARHGIAIDVAALRDTSRTLVGGRGRPARAAWLPFGTITAQLADTLDDLGRLLGHLDARRAPAARAARA